MTGYNEELGRQIKILHEIIKQNDLLYSLICLAEQAELKNYYIGAGCIAQTVWNYQSGNDPMYGISDFDFVYFDEADLSYETEEKIGEKIKSLISGRVEIDVKNEARVHLWYKSHFGYDIQPYISIESAINTWPTTATSVGVRIENSRLLVYAPFGLNDLFGRIVKANKAQITKEIYEKKVSKWLPKWPELTVIPW